eukprot:gene5834-7034_t
MQMMEHWGHGQALKVLFSHNFGAWQEWQEAMEDVALRLTGDKEHHQVRVATQKALGPLLHCIGSGGASKALVERFTAMISGQGDHIHRESMYKLCAYNFPAVAVTIGSKRWPELRPTYHTLLSTQSEDVQRSLAASLHIVAPLLCSPSVQRTSLVFALNTLLAGAPSNIKQCTLLHLHVTLNQVPVDVAMPFLELFPRLAEMDAESEDCSMWRLREAVARQLTHLAVLYGAAPTNSLFMPVALELCKDVVWAVRSADSLTRKTPPR